MTAARKKNLITTKTDEGSRAHVARVKRITVGRKCPREIWGREEGAEGGKKNKSSKKRGRSYL